MTFSRISGPLHELASRIVQMFLFVGDTVLDPFCGTGTTMVAALKTRRNTIGIELDIEYFRMAALYGVTTKAFNQAIKRNSTRFPEDFAFLLTPEEKTEVVTNCDHLCRLKFSLVSLRALTEHGALMAAIILISPRAVAMSVYVIRAFVRMREDLVANAAILKRLAEIDKTLLIHDAALREIFEKLRPLLAPPPAPPKPEIGFHVREDPVPYRASRRRKARIQARALDFGLWA
jgi:hypothetical protein